MKIRPIARWTLLVPLALLVLLLAAACGDDDDKGSSGGTTSGATGSDEQFVADICKAGKKFSTDLQKVMTDPSLASDPSKAIQKAAGPFGDFATAFAKAKPPKDLKDWHSDASKKFSEYVSNLKTAKDFSALGDKPFPDPPKDASDRLDKIAKNNQDCKDADFTFSD